MPAQAAGTRPGVVIAVFAAIAVVGAAPLAGCDEELRADEVAKVGDATISKSAFKRWMHAMAGQGDKQGKRLSYDPPRFTACVAAKRERPQARSAHRDAGEKRLRSECRREYRGLKRTVMDFLIRAEWTEQEAADRGIEVSESALRRSLDNEKDEAFRSEEAYQAFLRDSRLTERDLLFETRIDLLDENLARQVRAAVDVSDEEIERYHNENAESFTEPERRDVRVILAATKADAEAAKAAIEGGQAWDSVGKQHSVEAFYRSQGARVTGVTEGASIKTLDRAFFAAPPGEVFGPVKTRFGWYVFEVEKIKPPFRRSLRESRAQITRLLRAEKEEQAYQDFLNELREEHGNQTICAEGFVVPRCRDAPE